MIFTNLDASEKGLHGMFESSRLKATDVGRIYDVLVKDGSNNDIAVDNGVAVKLGAFTGNGLQEMTATIAGVKDPIAVIGAPSIVKEAMTQGQAQPYNFTNAAGKPAKAYEVLAGEQEIFAVADYQFTAAKVPAVGDFVTVDGKGQWVAATKDPSTTNGFVGKVHSIAVGSYYKMVRIECLQNTTIATV